MSWPRNRETVFLVCLETAAPMPANPSLARRLEAWKAVPCLSGAWLVPAPTTARTLYDSLAPSARDEDRLLVTELGPETAWWNLLNAAPLEPPTG